MSETIYTHELDQRSMSKILGVQYQHIDISNPNTEFVDYDVLLEKAWDSWRGSKHSEETKRLLSEMKKGVEFTEDHKNSLKESWKLRKTTEEYKTQIANHVERQKGNKNRLGKTHTDDVKKKLSECNKGKKLSAETKAKISAKMKEIARKRKA